MTLLARRGRLQFQEYMSVAALCGVLPVLAGVAEARNWVACTAGQPAAWGWVHPARIEGKVPARRAYTRPDAPRALAQGTLWPGCYL